MERSRSGQARQALLDQPGRKNPVGSAANNPLLRESASEAEDEDLLIPKSVDLNLDENKEAHNTYEYEQDELIVRRGQSFKLTVNFSRNYTSDYKINVQLAIGPNPLITKGTLLRLPVSNVTPEKTSWWKASGTWRDEVTHSVHLTVESPPDAIVGRYQLYVETTKGGSRKTYRKKFGSIYVLFNPWCEADQVYVEDEAWRQEYVMNVTGRIWQTPCPTDPGLSWNFGQFEEVCLETALYLLDRNELAYPARSDPTFICRCLSAMTNADDDGGILGGKWGEPYPGGIDPTSWGGSVAILEQFLRTKQSVYYGQCWVFSAITTTLLRALGIPTRSVTNFDSAHDCDADLRIDMVFDEDGNFVDNMSDSFWTFHVWNESWYSRPDLPEGYDGWQAHDGTPQELSAGVTRCGPAPVKAIKEGHGDIGFDTRFIFAEVNADRYDWTLKRDGTMILTSHNKRMTGKTISTKAVGSNSRMIITNDYKYEEGTKEERVVLERIMGRKPKPRPEPQPLDPEPGTDGQVVVPERSGEVLFDLEIPESLCLGNDFDILIHLTNKSREVRTTTCCLTAYISFYTGVNNKQIGKKVFIEKLQPREEKTCSIRIPAAACNKDMKPDSVIAMYLNGKVRETGEVKTDIEHLFVLKPNLELLAPKTVALHDKFDVAITFENPTKETLTNAVFRVEASGLTKPLMLTYGKDIRPLEKVSAQFSLNGNRAGKREIVASLSTDQLAGVTGSAEVLVRAGNTGKR